jgi:hypothetical protein
MSSFWVASNWSMLTGVHGGGGGGGLPRGACQRPCPQHADPLGVSSVASSVALVCTFCHKLLTPSDIATVQ